MRRPCVTRTQIRAHHVKSAHVLVFDRFHRVDLWMRV